MRRDHHQTVDREPDASADVEELDLRHGWPFRPLGVSLRLAAAAAVIAILSLFARNGGPGPRGPEDPTLALAPGFTPSAAMAVRPSASGGGPRLRFEDPTALDPVRVEPARLSPATGRREDALTQGAFEVIDAPFLRLVVSEAAATEARGSLFVTLARRAADGQGLSIIRTGERGRVDTKFGPVETLEATLGRGDSRICAGFATLAPGPLRIDGWLCAPLGQPPEARAIVCALDKLALNGQASPALDTAFAAAESRRDPGCGLRSAGRGSAGREAAETGSITPRKRGDARKIEAKLRRNAEARP